MSPTTLADIVLICHVLYVGFVVLCVPLIIAGGVMRWGWVRNVWFRVVHVLMIGIVVAESFLGIRCPLTVWERALRPDEAGYEDPDFIAAWLDRLLFYHFPAWVFTVAYTAFGILVVSLFFLFPVRRSKNQAY